MASLTRLLAVSRDAAGLRAWHNERCETFRKCREQEQRERAKDLEPLEPGQYVLRDLPTKFSFTKFLSPRPIETRRTPKLLTMSRNGPALESTYLILLALNEECRRIARGCFYHLPLRHDESNGHPCDMVFVDEIWHEIDTTTWDLSDWKERLNMCKAASCDGTQKMDMPKTARAYQLDNIYATHSDPTVEKHDNAFAWSRPLGDQSRVLIVYPHHHGVPYMSPINTAEHASNCASFPTPNDLSETFVPHRQPKPATVFGRRFGEGETATQNETASLLESVFRENRELILVLLYVWNKGPIPSLHGHYSFEKIRGWSEMLGTAKILWQELDNTIQNHNPKAQKAMLEYWPKE